MKRFMGLFVATIAASTLAIPAAGASPDPAPNEYQAGCDQLYEAGKQVFDTLIATAKPVMQPLEKGFCGENKYAK